MPRPAHTHLSLFLFKFCGDEAYYKSGFSRFGANESKAQASLIAFGTFGVGYFIRSIKAHRAGRKIFGMGIKSGPHFTFVVLDGYFQKFRSLWIAFCWFRHIIPLNFSAVFSYYK